MRDNVIFIGKDFFQALMSKLPFLYFIVILVIKANALSEQKLSVFRPDDFKSLSIELQNSPFWQKKENSKLINEQRKILVSVLKKTDFWTFKGAGQVNVPIAFCWQQMLRFEDLAKASSYFEEVTFDADKSILKAKIQFLGKKMAFEFALFQEAVSSEVQRLYYRTTPASQFQGIEGRIELLDAGQQSLVSSISVAETVPIWAPNWLLKLAAEGVMHHVAEHLRKAMESSYSLELQKKVSQ